MAINKTVFILGAGFTIEAGGPTQDGLLRQIFDQASDDQRFCNCRELFKEFLIETLKVSESALSGVSLEDVYTPIDRCLADGVSLRGKTVQELREIRHQLEYLISSAIDKCIRMKDNNASAYIQEFAKYLVETSHHRSVLAREATTDANEVKEYDPVSVISLNWDTVLDTHLHEQLFVKDKGETGDYAPIGVVDYCCYISSVERNEKRIRTGLWALGSKGYNVKLLKIHGSLNWLQCANCQRLYVSFGNDADVRSYMNQSQCRFCAEHGIAATFQAALVMPTFLKDLNNFQLKLVWQNAAIELMEAKRLVFIGYSLPYADYEFRQLLSRMVHKDCKITVVLYRHQTGTREVKDESSRKYNEECMRYSQFFSSHDIEYQDCGAASYVEAHLIEEYRKI